MTLMGICGRCAEEKPTHVPHERRRLVRGPDGEKLCSRHAKEAWNSHDVDTDREQIWAGDTRDLQEKLSDRYGVDKLWLKGDHYDEETDEYVYDALVYFDGDGEHLITDDVPVFGHSESGAAGVYTDTLPTEAEVMGVVEGVQ